jgi:hypothetical protein
LGAEEGMMKLLGADDVMTKVLGGAEEEGA